MAWETEHKRLDPPTLEKGVRALLQGKQTGFYMVATSGDSVVGSLMITTEWSDWRNGQFWWIQSVYVLPEYRRQGIYRNLYESVQALAHEESDVLGFRLYVEQENETAKRTYENLGMKKTVYELYEVIHRME